MFLKYLFLNTSEKTLSIKSSFLKDVPWMKSILKHWQLERMAFVLRSKANELQT